MDVRTSITHTLNVVEKKRGYWSSSSSDSIVTKYVIQVSLAMAGREPVEWQVARRYSHFRSNHSALSGMFSQLQLPRLPPKVISMERIGGTSSLPPDPVTVASRMVLLDTYLKQLLTIPAIGGCTQMRTFLGAYQGMQLSWFEEVPGRHVSDDCSDEAFAALTLGGRSTRAASQPPSLPRPLSPRPSEPPPSTADEALDSAKQRAALSTLRARYPADDVRMATALIDHLGLVASVESFGSQFEAGEFRRAPDATTALFQRFLNGMEAAIAVSQPMGPDGPNHGPDVLLCARDLLEDRLLEAIHDGVFGCLPEDTELDQAYEGQLGELARAMSTPEQLDVPAAFCDTRFNRWAAATAELRQMNERRTARGKMDCVMQCVLQLKQGLLECLAAKGKGGALGADELFPVFVFVVLHANPPRLASNIAYVQRFRSPMALKSEAGCYFTHLQAAVSFLESLASERSGGCDAAGEAGGECGSEDGGSDGDSGDRADARGATAAAELGASTSRRSSENDASAWRSTDDAAENISVSREALAQRRTQTVESAASSWERRIETLIGSQRPSESAALSRTPSAAASDPALSRSSSAGPGYGARGGGGGDKEEDEDEEAEDDADKVGQVEDRDVADQSARPKQCLPPNLD